MFTIKGQKKRGSIGNEVRQKCRRLITFLEKNHGFYCVV